MFPGCRGRTLANMSQTDWSDLGMTDLLPTGMVTLLLADVEGSTRLWESQSKEMAAAVARLDDVLTEVVARHQGVRPVEQGEGDSFVLAFARASDAVACALELQLAPLAPLRLRVGVHTGEVIRHRRAGAHCPRCGSAMTRGVVGGRTTWWCPQEQL